MWRKIVGQQYNWIWTVLITATNKNLQLLAPHNKHYVSKNKIRSFFYTCLKNFSPLIHYSLLLKRCTQFAENIWFRASELCTGVQWSFIRELLFCLRPKYNQHPMFKTSLILVGLGIPTAFNTRISSFWDEMQQRLVDTHQRFEHSPF